MHNMLRHVSLTRQFELRQKNWKPNMEVVEDAELYRVDGVLMGEYAPYPPNPTNEHEMKCFETWRWQSTVHDNGSDCNPADPPPRPPLLGGPRPPIVRPYECGDVYCYPGQALTFKDGKVWNYRDDEWCENPLVPKVTYEQQSTEELKNAGVWVDEC